MNSRRDERGARRASGNPYVVLGVSAHADQVAIRRAYRRLVRLYHPDLRSADPDAAAKFQAITAAYEILGDPERRETWDQGLGTGSRSKEGRRPSAIRRSAEVHPASKRTQESWAWKAPPLWVGPVRIEASAHPAQRHPKAPAVESHMRLLSSALSGLGLGWWDL